MHQIMSTYLLFSHTHLHWSCVRILLIFFERMQTAVTLDSLHIFSDLIKKKSDIFYLHVFFSLELPVLSEPLTIA